MSGFPETIAIDAATVGRALTELLNKHGLLISGQAWASTDETTRIFNQIGRMIDAHFMTTDEPITLNFLEAHRRTTPILSLADLDYSLLSDQLFGLLTHRVVMLEVDKLGLTTDNGKYEVTLTPTSLHVGDLCAWRTGWI